MKTILSIAFLMIVSFGIGQTKTYIRKAYDCDYCNEYRFKPIDVSTTEKVREHLCTLYWYTFSSSSTAKTKVSTEMMFKGDGTLTYVNPSDYDNIKREGTYTIGQKESFVVNKKTQYRVKITTSISGKQTIYYVVSFDGTYLFMDEKGHNPSFTAGKDVTISLIDHPELYEKKKESAETEVIATYVGAEYEGTCNLHFKEEDSTKLDFKYQWVEQYASGMAECTLNEIYKGKKFKIKYKFDNIKVYMNGSEFYVWEKKILSIELIE